MTADTHDKKWIRFDCKRHQDGCACFYNSKDKDMREHIRISCFNQIRRDAVVELKKEYVKSHGWYQDKDNPFNPDAWFNDNLPIGEENIDDVIELIRAKTLGEK